MATKTTIERWARVWPKRGRSAVFSHPDVERKCPRRRGRGPEPKAVEGPIVRRWNMRIRACGVTLRLVEKRGTSNRTASVAYRPFRRFPVFPGVFRPIAD